MAIEHSEMRQKGLYVEVHNNDINKAMRKLKKIIQSEGIVQTLREREFFESKGVKRKKAKARAIKRWQKKLSDSRAEDR